ncbi:MAG: signal peptide peptidase SppA [Bdellovibrio sp. CG10_big_fil_rev_8_21_14_0_10_47_8]|nr:MAG: signal peptide peptidase SppA [Bdellovibrio sp. CG10_big_fil_rev_8_21_14_0_10_47_8]
MKKNPWVMLFLLLFVFVSLFAFLLGTSVISLFGGREPSLRVMPRNSIMHLKLEGVIMDGEKFLKTLKKYREEKSIKAFVIEVNSPGGVVGPSQEIYEELNRTRTEFKKPVVAVSPGMIASGAFYAAMGADKLIVAPGAMVGSIGVIMEFANLEKLYDWAKVTRFTINTGKYKDSGAEYRAMRDDERQLFQDMINEVWEQFKEAVAKGRNMKYDDVQAYADGRVMTGASAVKIGFADEVGTVDHAFKVAADLAGIEKYEIFDIPKKRPGLFDLISGSDDEDAFSQLAGKMKGQVGDHLLNQVLRADLMNQPLFLLPGYWPH